MSARHLLRPLPLALLLVFAAVAVVDIVHSLREEPAPWPDLLADGGLRFHRWEPVLDLRARPGPEFVELLPTAVFDAGSWSSPLQGGRWALDDGAGFELGLVRGGHRTMIVECRGPGGGTADLRVEVEVNGLACGAFVVDAEWRRHLVSLPGELVRAGSNRISLRLPGRAPELGSRRAVLLRRLGLFFGDAVPPDAIHRRPPVEVELAAGRVSVRESGTLSSLFSVDERIDALLSSYRFTPGAGRAEITVARPDGGGPGRDAVMRRSLAARDGGEGSIRFPLHGRRGKFRFTAEVDLAASSGRFDLLSVRLVSEGVPSEAGGRRPSPPGG